MDMCTCIIALSVNDCPYHVANSSYSVVNSSHNYS